MVYTGFQAFRERWIMNGKVCPSLWYRYVDDTFTMFDSKNTANDREFLQHLKADVCKYRPEVGIIKF